MFFGLRLIGRIIGFVVKAALFVGVLAAVAGAAAYALFDGQAYKAKLSRHVLDLTGRTLTINGKAELDLNGWPPKIVLHDVRLKNPPWASKPYMARINRVEIRLNPLKAISGGDSVAQVDLNGADLTLETNPQGLSNWAFGAVGAGEIGALGVLGSMGLLGSTSTTPPVVISNPTVTFVGGAGGQTIALGGGGSTVVVTGGGAAAGGAGGAVAGAGAAAANGALGAAGGVASAGTDLLPPAAFGGTSGSHVLVAAAGDNNPCDGSPRTAQQAAKPH